MPDTKLTTEQMIAVIYDRSERVERALFDDPGIIRDVAVLKREVADVQKRAPTTSEKRAGWAAIAVAIVTALGSIGAAIGAK